MKKCLLTILAGALLIVSCQNYDDQFDDLNSQITALASQVAGLSKVQSDLTALQGTVSSLSGTISSQVDTALASGLAGINETIATLESQIDGIASSEEVAAIQSDVDDAQADLTELLNNSNVFNSNLVISTPSQLSAALAFGTKINIVNADVTITHETTMDSDSIQTVVDRIQTITGALNYTSKASSIKEITFNNLTGVSTITAKGVGYQFAELQSATNVYLDDAYKSKVRVIAFDKMTSVTSLNTGAGGVSNNKIAFNKATNLHLTALKRYPTSALELAIDEGGTIKIDALDNVDGSGKKTTLNLRLEGPSSINLDKFTKGTITLKNVATATVDNNTTEIVLEEGVVDFNSNSVVSFVVSGTSDLEDLVIKGVKNAATPAVGPTINFNGAANLTTLNLSGDFASVDAVSCGNLTDVTISGAVAGAVNLSTNTDLTNVTLAGSSMTGLTFSGNSDIVALTVDTTWSGTTINGSLVVTDNSSLESLTVSSDNIKTLTVTGNDDLAKIDFTAVTKVGADNKPIVNVWDNDLTASAVDAVETTSQTEYSAADLGDFSGDSGMDTLKTYLKAVQLLTAGATAYVFYDTMESYTDETPSESTDKLFILGDALDAQTNKLYITVLRMKANSNAGTGTLAKAAKRGYVLSAIADGDQVQLVANGSTIFTGGAGVNYVTDGFFDGLRLSGIASTDVTAIKNAAHETNATAGNVAIDAKANANSTQTVSIAFHGTGETVAVIGERHTTTAAVTLAQSATNAGIGYDDIITFSVGTGTGSNMVNVTSTTFVSAFEIADAIEAAWNGAVTGQGGAAVAGGKFGSLGTASATTIALVTQSASGVLLITSVDPGSGGAGNGVSMSMAPGDAATTHALNLDYKIGATRDGGDNATFSAADIVVTVESKDKGTVLNRVAAGITWSATGVTVSEVFAATNLNANSAIALYHQATESRDDARVAEDGTDDTASDAALETRVAWLKD